MTDLTDRRRRHGPVAWMAGNSVAANILMLIFIVGGLYSATKLKQEFLPDVELDLVRVTVPYPGASPEEVEQGIILAVEEAVRGLEGIDEVTSKADEGRGTVTIELLASADNQKLTQEIKQEVDRIVSFPEDAEEPQVVLVSRRREVLSLVLYGDQNAEIRKVQIAKHRRELAALTGPPEQRQRETAALNARHDRELRRLAEQNEHALRDLAETTRDALLDLPDITQIELMAVRPIEISIEVSQENQRKYNLTLGAIAQQVRRASVELPGGGIKTRGGEILVRMTDRRDYGPEFEDIPVVSRPDGTQVLLGEIAEINDGFADIDSFASYDGMPAVMMDVYRVGDQTPMGVSQAVRDYIEESAHLLPEGFAMAVRSDQSDVFRQRMELLTRNGAWGLVLVLVLLATFLEARLAFWVTMGIPISFLGTFLIMPALGVSINMVSMFAFIIALGIVVDDAIVVGENIYRYHQQGVPFLAAAVKGTREVALPVTFSILTNIATFMPLFFVPGVIGKIFRAIPGVVVLAFTISLIECMFILPAHLGHQKDWQKGGFMDLVSRPQRAFSHWFSRMIEVVYGPFLRGVLHHRYLTIAVGLATLAVTVGYVASGRMGMTPFEKIESDTAIVTAVLPYGTAVEVTTQVRDKLLAAAEDIRKQNGGKALVEGVYDRIGSGGGHVAEVRIYLTPPENRPMTTSQVVDLWRKKVGPIAGVESLVFESDRGGPGSGAAMTIELNHQSMDVLKDASRDLAEALGNFPKVKDINDGFSPGKQQFNCTLRPEGRSLGLTAFDVARQVRSSFYGAEAIRQQRGRNEVKVMVRLPRAQRVSEYDLDELLIRSPSGIEVPLFEAVTASRDRAYTNIDRRDGRRAVSVTADLKLRSEAGQVLGKLGKTDLPALVAKYPGLTWRFSGRQEDMKESLSSLKSGFVIAIIVVYILLAIPFGSYAQPAIIMVSIPFGIVGAVVGHILLGYSSLTVMSMMGIVALSGVVVNDSLILIEFANRRYKEGLSAFHAVHEAGIRRFRPIMLTTMTTFGGLAPMMLETSRQARFLIPMAISLGFGILFATLISLLLVPSLFMVVEDIRRLIIPQRIIAAEPPPLPLADD